MSAALPLRHYDQDKNLSTMTNASNFRIVPARNGIRPLNITHKGLGIPNCGILPQYQPASNGSSSHAATIRVTTGLPIYRAAREAEVNIRTAKLVPHPPGVPTQQGVLMSTNHRVQVAGDCAGRLHNLVFERRSTTENNKPASHCRPGHIGLGTETSGRVLWQPVKTQMRTCFLDS